MLVYLLPLLFVFSSQLCDSALQVTDRTDIIFADYRKLCRQSINIKVIFNRVFRRDYSLARDFLPLSGKYPNIMQNGGIGFA